MLQPQNITPLNVPVHIAVIMDGNGRWAQARGLARTEGHIQGVEAVRRVITAASNAGVRYLTLYAFSTENWNRPREEVDAILQLIVVALEKETPDLIKNNVRLNAIGDIERMTPEARASLSRSIEATACGTGLQVNLALSYSSRWEITEAVKKIAGEVSEGTLSLQDVDADMVSSHLTTAGIPDPDLLIRTGGDTRISNFLLWQIAYAELYFSKVFWPDFSEKDLTEAIESYGQRQRRYGLTGEQVTKKDKS